MSVNELAAELKTLTPAQIDLIAAALNLAKKEAPCTVAAVQDAKNEPSEAQKKNTILTSKKQAGTFPALHYENVVPGSEQFRWLGGADRIRSLQMLMEQVEGTLAECPFCGSKTYVRGGFTYASPCVRVQCFSCRCETSILPEGKNLGDGKYYPLEQCILRAAATWNRRVCND